MRDTDRLPTLLRVIACSAWPMVLPIAWYTRELQQMRRALSTPGAFGGPDWLRAQYAKTNGLILSMLTHTAVKSVLVLFWASVLTCVIVRLRRQRGAGPTRIVIELGVGALLICAYLVTAASVRAGMDLSRLIPSAPELLTVWSILAAGCSFLLVTRPSGGHGVAA